MARLSVELRGDLDLLPARKEVRDGNTRDSRHLSLVEDAHQLLHQAQRQVGVLNAVHRQAPSGELVTVLKLGNHTVMHILFLFAEEVGGNRIEREGAQFVLSQDDLQHVELYAAFDIDLFGVACTHRL